MSEFSYADVIGQVGHTITIDVAAIEAAAEARGAEREQVRILALLKIASYGETSGGRADACWDLDCMIRGEPVENDYLGIGGAISQPPYLLT